MPEELLYMICHRKHLTTPIVRRRIGFMMARFKKGTEWWEIQVLVRKVILTGMLVYLPPTTRAALAVLLCLVAVILLNYFRPYCSKPVFWVWAK